jgi:hypothetical protein
MPDLTQARLRELLTYDPATGIFTRCVGRGGVRAGSVAGCVWEKGANGPYLRISIDGRQYSAHRLAFLWITGEFPPDDVDHIDGDGLNNRLGNLRAATRTQNLANRRRHKNNTSGFKGVSFHKRERRFRAKIQVGGKTQNLGSFDTAESAHAAYCAAAEKTHGAFARAK